MGSRGEVGHVQHVPDLVQVLSGVGKFKPGSSNIMKFKTHINFLTVLLCQTIPCGMVVYCVYIFVLTSI